MRAALRLARRGAGATSPNPAVGAVVVKAGRMIGRGWHRKAGCPHAEAAALASAAGPVKGATLYVTLEPCCTHGRTPPCTDAIIRSGIGRVVVGALDPNPAVSGRGVGLLRAAGVEVISGVLGDECRSMNEAYNRHITTGLPFVVVKLAASLDGRIAIAGGESRWISGPRSRRYVHRLRSVSDAVMVGSSTVEKDDPLLTVRSVRGKNPMRVVLDTSFKTPLSARMFRRHRRDASTPRAMVFTANGADPSKAARALASGIGVIRVPRARVGVSLKRVLKELGKRGVMSVLVEGGGVLAASFIREGLADKLVQTISPLVIGADGSPSIGPLGVGSLKAAPRLVEMRLRRLGPDIMVEGYLRPAAGRRIAARTRRGPCSQAS
jgi:diaminohydroxyphosphoribosylaminopyrimidine deaminase/5-amino-6-(5-phosphoribosylamino)uracil reductase